MAENQLCILVVDDHVMTCDGIAALVEKQTSCAVTAAYSSTAALDILNKKRIHIAFIDARMPGMSGIDLIQLLRKENTTTKLVAMTSFDEDDTLLELLRTGVNGILLKRSASGIEIKQCLDAIVNGNNFYSTDIQTRLQRGEFNLVKETIRFTRRDVELITLLAKGYATKQVAEALSLKENTIEDYRKELLKKTNSKNSTELVSYALRNGLIELPR